MALLQRLAGLTRTTVLSTKVRTGIIVRQDLFDLNIRGLRLADQRFLAHLPERQYDALLGKLKAAQPHVAFEDLLIDPPHQLLDFPFEKLPLDFLRENIRGMTLDLTGLRDKFLAFSRRNAAPPQLAQPATQEIQRLSEFLDVLWGEKRIFQAKVGEWAREPGESGVEQILGAVEHAFTHKFARLGFSGLTIDRTGAAPASAGQLQFRLESSRGLEAVVRFRATALPADKDLADALHKAVEQYFLEVSAALTAVRAGNKTAALRTKKLLTDNLLFDPQSGAGYPRNADEYNALIAQIVDAAGRFPGDSDALTPAGTYAPKMPGVSHLTLKRKGKEFQVEILAPSLHAQGVKNRLIFDADLISQAASFESYGTAGVSYDRESYYVRRLFNAEIVPFIRLDGFPVSFAALQGFQTSFQEQELYYAFIHFTMTRGAVQGYGLTSYLVREGLSSLYYRDVWRNKPNLMIAGDGQVKDYRLRMWAFAHSGRFTPFYAFVKGLGGVGEEQQPVADAIIGDVHQRITSPDDQAVRGKPLSRGVIRVNGGSFPIAADRQVYPANTRYPVKDGKVLLSQSEIDLPTSIRQVWLDMLGGEEGVAQGNGLYFGGLVTFGRIQDAKKREKEREGGGVMERTGNWLRQSIISRDRS